MTNIVRRSLTAFGSPVACAAAICHFGGDALALAARTGALRPEGWLRLLCGGAVVAIAAWLLLAWVACNAAALPGLAGRVSDRLAARIAPATLRRALAVGLTASIWLPAAQAGAVPLASTQVAAVAAGTGAGASPAAATPALRPAPASPMADDTRPGLPDPSLRADPPRPAPATRAPAASPAPAQSVTADAPRTVVVAPGDTLWSLAATHLGGSATTERIAVEWPRWFESNRRTLDNPDLLQPGQTLLIPSTRTDTP